MIRAMDELVTAIEALLGPADLVRAIADDELLICAQLGAEGAPFAPGILFPDGSLSDLLPGCHHFDDEDAILEELTWPWSHGIRTRSWTGARDQLLLGSSQGNIPSNQEHS